MRTTGLPIDTLNAVSVGALVLQFITFLLIFILFALVDGAEELLADLLELQFVRLAELSEFPACAISVLASGPRYENGFRLVIEEASVREDHLAAIEILSFGWRKKQFDEGLERYFLSFVQAELAFRFIFKFFGLVDLFSANFAILLFGLRFVSVQVAPEIGFALIYFYRHPCVTEGAVIRFEVEVLFLCWWFFASIATLRN